jgi:hypothetical protein
MTRALQLFHQVISSITGFVRERMVKREESSQELLSPIYVYSKQSKNNQL